ncbi:hypothetical protein PVK06_025009 [Gossypium arboreum]|uniref:Reverse transcriptase n=1 Tax=Gossypium arboreum TaxID=29729 RepID=A0ABR0PFG3_GOSAR|nr:hypothetical protein PVK06_025009 [Gossypium arboreum]
MLKLEPIQKALKHSNSVQLRVRDANIQLEIENVLTQEELLCFQNLRRDWFFNRDRNTSLFHNRTIKRCKQNKTEALKIDGTGWCYDDEVIKSHAIEYFSKLYIVEQYSIENFPVQGRFPKLEDCLLSVLNVVVTMDEVRQAVFSMAPLKAPGVDGFHAKFYQANRDIVGNSVFKMVRLVYIGEPQDLRLSKTLLVFILKILGVESIN